MEHDGKSFPEAVETLARDAGMTVPHAESAVERERREESSDLSGMLLEAAKFYRARLKESPTAIAYLKRRGLTGAIAAHFGIGYAPGGWQNLATAFPDYDNPALDAAGLVVKGDGGKRYDRFRDRVMFPIHDTRGRVIGFGGRVLETGDPKYLNSPETALFSKGRELYGVYLARNAIRAAGRVVVVEGYMDVVALAQHGIDYAVATLGTATTPIHVQKLFRLADLVVFCFDGDVAGRKAAWRALENALPALVDGKEARFLFLPDGKDPDDFIRGHGKTAFERAIDAATPLSQYLLAELAAQHPPQTSEGRAAFVAAAQPYVKQIVAPALGAFVRRQFAELAGLPEAQMQSLLGSESPRGRSLARAPVPARGPARRPPSLIRAMLQGLLIEPSLARRHELPRPADHGPEGAAWRALVEHCATTPGEPTMASVVQHFTGTEHDGVLAEILASAADQELSPDQAETQVLAAAERLRHGEEQRALQALFRQPLEQLSAEERESLTRGLSATARGVRRDA
jgi:DNA primase